MSASRRHASQRRGPRTFISYSFADASLATALKLAVENHGLQVTMIDEGTLLGKDLDLVLPKLIQDSEVMVLLLTAHSNVSPWVRREIDWCFEHIVGHGGRIMIPVVLDGDHLHEKLTTFAYIDATGSGLDDRVVDLICATAQQTVWALPLREDDPFALDRAATNAMLRSDEDRRVVFDANNWCRVVLDEVESAAADLAHEQNARAYLAQEREEVSVATARLTKIDLVARRLARELKAIARTFDPLYPDAAAAVFDCFARLVNGYLLRRWGLEPVRERYPSLLAHATRIQQMIDDVEATKDNWEGHLRLVPWALRECEDFWHADLMLTEIECKPSGCGMTLYFPASVLGTDAQWHLQLRPSVAHYVDRYTWATLGLPQVAFLSSLNARTPDDVERVCDMFAWKVEDCSIIGLP